MLMPVVRRAVLVMVGTDGMVWLGMVCHGLVWYGMVWCSIVLYGIGMIWLVRIACSDGRSFSHVGLVLLNKNWSFIHLKLRYPEAIEDAHRFILLIKPYPVSAILAGDWPPACTDFYDHGSGRGSLQLAPVYACE